MGKSLKDLFEISEVLDIKQEMIAKILMFTSDQDNNPADEPFQELARKLEEEEISVREAQEALDAMTKGEIDEVGTKTLVVGRNKSKQASDFLKDGDVNISSASKQKVADAIRKGDEGEEIEVQTKSLEEEVDDEGRMAKHDLLKLTQYSAKLYKSLGDNDQLPGWIQAKITLAADYIGTVKHYLEGEQAMGGEEAPSGQLQEEVETEYYNWEDLHLPIFVSEKKPLEDIPDFIFLPLAIDGRRQLSLLNLKKMMELPKDYQSKYGSKEELVKRELGYVERDFYNWKDSFEDMMEGDEEVVVTCDDKNSTVYVEKIGKMSDDYSAGKAKGDTSDVYESSIMKILSK